MRFLLALLVFLPLSAISQYTDMINTNQPGGSQGAFAVGKKVLQFESGITLGQEKHNLLFTETNLFNWDYSIRYGLFKEELEVSLMGSFQRNKVTYSQGFTGEDAYSNFKSNTLGAKYLLYDPYRKRDLEGPNLYSWKANNRFQWEDLIPAVSIYAGANFDFADNPFLPYQESTISPKVVLSTQNNFVGSLVLVTNIFADRITTDFPTYGYIVTLTHATNRYFSIFVENQGFKSDFYSDQLIRAGAAVLIYEDLHLDVSLTKGFKDTPSVFYGRVGVAYRFDMHGDDEFLEEKGKAGRALKRAEKDKNKALKKALKEKKKNKKKRKDSFEIDDNEGDDNGGI
ncbi:MAG: phenol meta deg superfamily protein [Flavobacteriaceae bacterium]|nr:phenol meta deg superfamily protein [Flavobacteriaceae bacterium]|tara:strand:+ start:195753 stop:196778 length:1026 start_codon:yes stop_codon:yes gene_type:complete